MKRTNMLRTLLAAMLVCASAAFAADTAPVKGNPKSKICHKSTCHHYGAKGSTTEFKSETEAKQAGYKMCKQCSKASKTTKTEPAK